MQTVFWIIFAVTILAGLFYYMKCEALEEKIYKLEDELYEAKALRHRSELMMIKDKIDAYKHGANPYTTLSNISDVINKTALESDQTY